jgi:hypothetical protein
MAALTHASAWSWGTQTSMWIRLRWGGARPSPGTRATVRGRAGRSGPRRGCRVEEALAARTRAVELVPAQPPTRLRARVTAAVAMALVDARRPAEARRWCDEALAAARGAGSADEEADVLISQGIIEQYDDPAKACSLFAAARAQAAGVGNPEIELRALYDLAEVSNQLGDLATACAASDEGAELAERTGLGWSAIAILLRRGQLKAHYRNGDWETGTSASGCWRQFRS